MRRTGITTTMYFKAFGIEGGFAKMRGHGYRCADYQGFVDTETALFRMSAAEFEKQLIFEKNAATAAGIDIYQVHAPWRYPPRDASVQDRAERAEKMKKAIEGARILGAGYFAVHPIMPYGADADPEPERFFELNFEFFSGLIPTAKANDVVLCIENMPMKALSLSEPEQVLRLVKTLNSDSVGMCLDTGHCSVFGLSPAEELKKAKDFVKILHIHDNDGERDWHWMPFQGVTDWKSFRAALKELDGEIPASIEAGIGNNTPEELRESFQRALADAAAYIAN